MFYLLICGTFFFFRFRVAGTKKKLWKWQVDWSFSELCLNISRTNSKTSKVNQQSVSNISLCHHFPKIWIDESLLTLSLSKIHRQNIKQIIFRVGGLNKKINLHIFYSPKYYSMRVRKSTNKNMDLHKSTGCSAATSRGVRLQLSFTLHQLKGCMRGSRKFCQRGSNFDNVFFSWWGVGGSKYH